jgi:glutathione S-transferase
MRKSDFLRINPRGKVPALLDADPSEISAARDALVPELAWAERICADGLTVREPSAADYAIYPWLAMLSRLEERQSHHGFRLPESLRLYMAAIE